MKPAEAPGFRLQMSSSINLLVGATLTASVTRTHKPLARGDTRRDPGLFGVFSCSRASHRPPPREPIEENTLTREPGRFDTDSEVRVKCDSEALLMCAPSGLVQTCRHAALALAQL
jgi:hypothetical protein